MRDFQGPTLSALLESLPDAAIFVVDRDLRYVYFNEDHRRIAAEEWGAEIGEGTPLLDGIPATADREEIASKLDRALSGEFFSECEERPTSGRWRETYWRPVLDDGGSIVGALAIASDVSRRVNAEESGLAATRLLEESQALAHVGGWEYDVSTKRITWTAEVYRIYGVGTDFDTDDLGRNIGYYAPPSAAILEKAFSAALGGTPYDLELELLRGDGKSIWVRTIGKPVWENGAIARVSGNIMDITERKVAQLESAALNAELESRIHERTARLEAATADLKSFVYTVSHDLKAPLRAIAGFSRMIAEDYAAVLDDEGKRRLDVVYENAARLDSLISDIRSLSRIGRSELAVTDIEMGTLARTVFRKLLGDEDPVSVSLSVDDIPDAAGDYALVRKVWENLLSNAIKFTAGKSPRTVRVTAESEGPKVRYLVRDNGVGFNAAYAGKLFGLFQRLHSPTEYQGTGAGLAVVKRIVELHGGRVGAEGAEGKGAVFWFTLPRPGDEGALGSSSSR